MAPGISTLTYLLTYLLIVTDGQTDRQTDDMQSHKNARVQFFTQIHFFIFRKYVVAPWPSSHHATESMRFLTA